MGDRTSSDRCPYPLALGAYAAIIVAVAVFLSKILSWNVWIVLCGAALATSVVAVVVEVLRRKPNTCSWLDFGTAERVVLYLALFLVGLAVVFPGVWPSREVEWFFRLPCVLFALAAVALLRVHRIVDHGDLEESGVSRGIFLLSRSPLYLLVALVAMPVVLGILWLIRGSR